MCRFMTAARVLDCFGLSIAQSLFVLQLTMVSTPQLKLKSGHSALNSKNTNKPVNSEEGKRGAGGGGGQQNGRQTALSSTLC